MPKPVFQRKKVVCHRTRCSQEQFEESLVPVKNSFKVLIINSSLEMARKITLHLKNSLPESTLIYAPTLEAARLLLSRGANVSLVVSSAVLPDGSVSKLHSTLERLPLPPDLVVVSDADQGTIQLPRGNSYRFASAQKLGGDQPLIIRRQSDEHKIKSLGADIRNDLNNPLQEIVACVFVAQTNTELAPITHQALKAIESAALNMASVVGKIEERIRESVAGK